MKQEQISIRVLEPDEGKVLTNGETYSYKVYLGIYDDSSNWVEIPVEEIPPDIEL